WRKEAESRVWHVGPIVYTPMNNNTSLFNRRKALWAAGALALAGVFATGAQSVSPDSEPAVDVNRDPQPVNRGPRENGSFSNVVKQVAPSVVKITTSTKARRVATNAESFPGFDHPMFRQFFGGRVPEIQQPPQSGLGSGVIISDDGYIAT